MAMKFEGDDADDRLIAVAICGPDHDVLLATRNGRSIRFPANDVRVFTGRSSVGVRGVKLAAGDAVISLSILRHEEVDTPVRAAYLRLASQRRRGAGEEGDENGTAEASISEEQFADLASREEFLRSATEKGFGVRSSELLARREIGE